MKRMRREGNTHVYRRLIAICAFLIICFQAASARAEIDLTSALAMPGLNPGFTSIAVVDATSGKPLAEHQADLRLNPASCAKILTAFTALAALGADYRFPTQFLASPAPAAGTVGTLFVRGFGDPSLVNEELELIAQGLRAKGIDRITGGIVIDNSAFDSFDYPKKPGDGGRAFTAMISPVAVNFNSVGVEIGPGARNQASITLKPPIDLYRIKNRTSRGRFGITMSFGGDGGNDLIVTGRVPARFSPQVFWRAVPDPVSYAGATIKYFLEQSGISVQGPIQSGLVPANATLLTEARSKPLSDIVSDMMKHSNNFQAEQLLKHLGAMKIGLPGSTAKGVWAVKHALSSIGIPQESFEMENGSGLSLMTRVSARQLAHVLSAAYRTPSIRQAFIQSLSVLGVDGTMKRWGNRVPGLRGEVYAKTGTLNGVVSLSGYVTMPNGRVAAFAILANHLPKGAYAAQQAELDVVKQVAGGAR